MGVWMLLPTMILFFFFLNDPPPPELSPLPLPAPLPIPPLPPQPPPCPVLGQLFRAKRLDDAATVPLIAPGVIGVQGAAAAEMGDHPISGSDLGPVDRKSTTSELQSQSNLVCRLLLEKKK